jgi:hypothetical protein
MAQNITVEKAGELWLKAESGAVISRLSAFNQLSTLWPLAFSF